MDDRPSKWDRELALQSKIETLLIERERLLWGLRRIIIAEGQYERHSPNGHDYYDGYEDGICWAKGVAEEAIEKAGLKGP